MYFRILLAFAIACFSGGIGSAQDDHDVKLELTEAALPDSFSSDMKGLVDQGSYTVSVDGETSAHFWFREDPQLASTPSSELGVTFGQIESGSLVGVIQLVQTWSDYKENSIAPGDYTMRYCVMPADGNHMGVSPYRDFLLLIPAAEDTDPNAVFDYAEMVSSSVQATGVPHPAVLALFPIWEEVTEPTLTKNDLDQWTLAVKLGDQVLGLVVVGHGEI